MLQEMKLEDALKKFLQGRKVLVMYDETLEAERLCIRWQHRKNCPPKSLFGKNQRQRL